MTSAAPSSQHQPSPSPPQHPERPSLCRNIAAFLKTPRFSATGYYRYGPLISASGISVTSTTLEAHAEATPRRIRLGTAGSVVGAIGLLELPKHVEIIGRYLASSVAAWPSILAVEFASLRR